jgi:hypothetical protein
MLVLARSGRHASSMDEKEALVRLAFAAPYTPWVSIFRVGAPCERGKVIAWFPCALLVSAVHRSRRVALEYRSWLPETVPAFDRKEARQRFADVCEPAEPGTWISRNNAGICSAEGFLRDTRIVSGVGGDDYIEAESVYFPDDATVPALEAARTLRVFYRTGLRANYFTWTASPRTTTDTDLDRACPAGTPSMP